MWLGTRCGLVSTRAEGLDAPEAISDKNLVHRCKISAALVCFCATNAEDLHTEVDDTAVVETRKSERRCIL